MDAIVTPSNQRQSCGAINTVTAYPNIEWPVRKLLFKIALAFDRIQFNLVTAKKRIQSYERQPQDLRLQTKKKGAVNLKQQFPDIAAVKEAQNQ